MRNKIYIEGIARGTYKTDITAEFDAKGDGNWLEDKVHVTVICVDEDVDSDNTRGVWVPERDEYEDRIEDATCKTEYPGKFVVVNDGDADGDGVIDYADWQIMNGLSFVPYLVRFQEPLDMNKLRMRLIYDSSDPAVVTNGTLPSGKLRLWRKNAWSQRDPRSLNAGGDYVAPDEYGGSDLQRLPWLSARTMILGMEGVNAADRTQIQVEVDPDGTNGPAQWVHLDVVRLTIIQVDIAMDGNRDDTIDFDDLGDAKYLFWVNDDHDQGEFLQTEWIWVEDDTGGSPDYNNDYIGNNTAIGNNTCRRDLEDFTRLHIRVDDNTVNLPGVTYFLKFENISSGTPSVNIFEAVDESTDYLKDGTVADQQLQKTRLLTVGASEVSLPSQYVKTGNQRSPFILEGKSAGKGDLTLIVKKDGNEVCRRAVTLELRPVTKFYQVFQVATVGQNSTDVSAGYNPDFTSSDDYLLFVHGFNVNATDKTYWPGTVFKRLWWQGYKGHFGWFDWPCVVRDWWDLNPEFFDSSENIAWQCGNPLLDRINQLNSGVHSGKVRLLAHSQGNIIVGEALRNASGVVLQTYIASQAAVAGDHYQTDLPQNTNTYGQPFPTTPNVLSHYPVTGSPYFESIFQKVSSRRVFDYFNAKDYALRRGYFNWEKNNAMKPDFSYWYTEGDGNLDTYNPAKGDRFYYDNLLIPFDERTLTFPDDRVEIFSRAAEARSYAFGTDVPAGVEGLGSFDLESMPLPYNEKHYSHSRHLRSNIIDERQFWRSVLRDGVLPYNQE